MKVETRSFNCEVRTEETENAGVQLIGRPIVFESRTNMGYCDEIICRNALDDADLTDVRFLVNHDTKSIPLARARADNPNSTMKISIDEKGMTIRVNLDTANNPVAGTLYSAVKRGDVTGMSFMFRIRGDEWKDIESDHPTRYVQDISAVYEVSAVTFPAYPETEIQVN
ncbi:MAG: HK97 family phage prohead protease [Ruminococcus sp.]|nr:HK97 family phage prohead protease [Ruminococcus sp.]